MIPNVVDHSLAVIGLDICSGIVVMEQPARSDQLVVDDGAVTRRYILFDVSVCPQLQRRGVRRITWVQGGKGVRGRGAGKTQE